LLAIVNGLGPLDAGIMLMGLSSPSLMTLVGL